MPKTKTVRRGPTKLENRAMINGAHFLLCSRNPDADQEVLRTILLRSVPAEEGRLIFALPAAEIATHSGTGNFLQNHAGRDLTGLVLYLMCDDLHATVAALKARKIGCTEIEETEFGLKTTINLPSGGELGLYQPSHLTAVDRG
jgi:hypothetical protein